MQLCTSHPQELYEITVSKVWPGFSFSKDYFSKLLFFGVLSDDVMIPTTLSSFVVLPTLCLGNYFSGKTPVGKKQSETITTRSRERERGSILGVFNNTDSPHSIPYLSWRTVSKGFGFSTPHGMKDSVNSTYWKLSLLPRLVLLIVRFFTKTPLTNNKYLNGESFKIGM